MNPLADWSPKELRKIYTAVLQNHTYKKLNTSQIEIQEKKTAALLRLGTYSEMQNVWKKLLALNTKTIKHSLDIEIALVGGICGQILQNSSEENSARPSDKNKVLKDISKKITELQKLIKRSKDASYEDAFILETLLYKKNIEHRNQCGEKIEDQSPNYYKNIDRSISQILYVTPLDEHMSWKERSDTQCLGWWVNETINLKLTDILDYYSQRMSDYSEIYKVNYAKYSTKLCKGLSWLMNELYGKNLDEYVAVIINTILDEKEDLWDKDRVRKNRLYKHKKNSGSF